MRGIVVALQRQQAHAGKRLPGRIGHDAGVGHVAEGVAAVSPCLVEPKPVGVGRIVGRAEGAHGQAGRLRARSPPPKGSNAAPTLATASRSGAEAANTASLAHTAGRAPAFASPRRATPSPFVWSPWSWVITTARSRLQIEPGLLGPGEEVPLADAAVDKHPLARRRVLRNGSVPATAAGQYVQSKH